MRRFKDVEVYRGFKIKEVLYTHFFRGEEITSGEFGIFKPNGKKLCYAWTVDNAKSSVDYYLNQKEIQKEDRMAEES